MLTIFIDGEELFNEESNTFLNTKPTTVRLEHSLISISKWESIWEKPFIPAQIDEEKSTDEQYSYMKCMIIGPIPKEHILHILWHSYGDAISKYIDSSSTATTIKKQNRTTRSSNFVTSELIYYWMIAYNIPFETEKWHLNRLLTLIEICNIKQEKPKKGNRKALLRKQRSLNQQRRAQLNSTG